MHYLFITFSCFCISVVLGAPVKNTPLGIIHYLSYCTRCFYQIYSFYGGEMRLYPANFVFVLWFKNYNYLNLKVHFSK